MFQLMRHFDFLVIIKGISFYAKSEMNIFRAC